MNDRPTQTPPTTGEAHSFVLFEQVRRARRLAGQLTDYGDRLGASPADVDRIANELSELAAVIEDVATGRDVTGRAEARRRRTA